MHKLKELTRRAHAKAREKMKEKRFWSVFLAVVIIIVGVLVAAGTVKNGKLSFGWWSGGLTMEQVKAQTERYISKNLTNGKNATIKEITDMDGVYKIIVQVDGAQSTIESFVTKDGNLFFPSGLATDKNPNSAASAGGNPVRASNAPKSAKPVVELFVMSYCPFGTQIEKGIVPVVQALGNTIDFKLKFVNYVMHQEKELDENIKQYCISQVAPDKLVSYVGCFVGGTDSAECLAKNGINAQAVANCSAATDQKYALTATYNDQTKWKNGFPPFPIYQDDNVKYSVAGSPTLVINGVQVDSGARDSASLLNTICSAFTDKPAACSVQLSSVAPGPGIGNTASAAPSAGAANCGN